MRTLASLDEPYQPWPVVCSTRPAHRCIHLYSLIPLVFYLSSTDPCCYTIVLNTIAV
ncbi:hypothetical protein BD779DRAFT_1564924 [Infundibulicybe gibba]|nr:hypothetical protein BD779DRAFT_1564924 [Infundibulicybe gibba]